MFEFMRPNKWREKGSIIVLTAMLLPFLLACTGIAFDMGNLYIHKSRLQNTTDSAALAGGSGYASVTSSDNDQKKQEADRMAQIYVDKNAVKNNALGHESFSEEKYQVQTVDGVTYYRVKLTENVPVFFLRLFLKDDNGDTKQTQAVSADSIVAIKAADGKSNDVFIFRKNLHGVNSIENPDNFNIQGQIKTTFDGIIAFTDGSGNNLQNTYQYDYLQYSTQSNDLKYFFTEKARNENLSVNQAIKKGTDYAHQEEYTQYDMDELGNTTKDRLHLPDYVSGVDWGAIDWSKSVDWNAINAQQAAAQAYTNDSSFNGKKDMRSSDLSVDRAWTAKNGDGNVSITIDSAISGSSDSPVYVYLDKNITQVNFQVNSSNERPLVLVYQGSGKLQMNMSNGNTFRGIVYAPNVNDSEGVLINANGGTFQGSIIANAINLQGGKGTYKYEDFDVTGASGINTGNGKNSQISLVNPKDIDESAWT